MALLSTAKTKLNEGCIFDILVKCCLHLAPKWHVIARNVKALYKALTAMCSRCFVALKEVKALYFLFTLFAFAFTSFSATKH